VKAVNDAPVADAKSVSTDEDTAVTVTPTGSDVDGDKLAFTVVAAPAHGAVTVNADGTFTYTPAANFNGADSFTYKANDGAADSSPATVSIAVRPVNDAPVANGANLTTDEDLVLNGTAVATDVDGDKLMYLLVSGPAHGTLQLNADGTFAYTPAANYNGSDSFTYKANDGTVDSNTATVSISVKAVNDAPTLTGATFTLPENSPNGTAVGTVAGSDVDGDALTYSIVGGNTSGAFAVNPTTGQITVANVAALDFERTPTFTLIVQVKDAGGLTGQAQVTVNLTDVPEEASVAIDILPGEDGRSVNIKSHGKIEVAILSTSTFDARTVDVNSLRFGRTGQEDSLSRQHDHGHGGWLGNWLRHDHDHGRRHGDGHQDSPRYRLADVNHDGRLDLVVSFETERTGFRPGDTTGTLTGRLLDGTSFTAKDSVSIQSPRRCR
jgi:VCBS repeat-containing protein